MSATYPLLGLLYFIQGIPYGLQSGLLPIYFRTVGLSFSKISLAKVLYLPWVFKVVWAPIVDQYFTKKTWLLLTIGGLVLACLTCSFLTPEVDFLPVATVLLLMNLFASVQDVAVDGLAIQLLGQDQVGYGNTIQVVAYKLGSVLAGGGLLTFLHYLGWAPLFVYLTILYALAVLYIWNSDLGPGHSSSESRAKDRTLNPRHILRELFGVPGTAWTAGFVLIYKLGEQGSTSMFPLFLLDHYFSPQKLGFWNGIVAMFFSIAGSSLGGHLMSKQRHPLSLLKALLMLRCCSLTFQILLMGIYKDSVFIFEVAAILSICIQHLIAGSITTVTFSIMMHCTQKAEESIQATHYSFLATLEVLGKLGFSAVVGSLVDWLGFFHAFYIFLTFSFASVLYMLPAAPARV
ncbi:major facilitator superfamily domain-containing protein 3 [Tiliqua scincoides]|uniref:major facilitator superfamily domain-containing protein 3 n=1 Tax=Tiliqua scincoides TaxID=71010 RepID=UPI003462B69D